MHTARAMPTRFCMPPESSAMSFVLAPPEAHPRQGTGHQLRDRLLRLAQPPQAEGHVVEHVHGIEEAALLEHVRDRGDRRVPPPDRQRSRYSSRMSVPFISMVPS